MDITYQQIKDIVYGKMIAKTDTRSFEELSEILFGKGVHFGESEVRRRMHGMKRIIEIIESEKKQGVVTTILSISDLHVPFQKPIELLADHAGNIDILQLNGDILDMFSISKFPKAYRVSPIKEMISARQYLIDLINFLKPKKVVANYGNHELRMGNYLNKHIDTELKDLLPETALDYIFVDGFTHYDKRLMTRTYYEPLIKVFTDVEIEYTGKWYSQIGNTIFCHPKAFSTAPLKTAEKALYWFRNEGFVFDSLVMAHTHHIGYYSIGNTSIYEQGAFCETEKMGYTDGQLANSQKQGCILVCQDDSGKLIYDKTKLIPFN